MKRLALAVVVALTAASLAVAAVTSQAGLVGPQVSFVQGVGTGPAPSVVDVYSGETDATSWDLLEADMAYGDIADLGTLPAGDMNILLCSAVPAPAATVMSCPSGAINGNFGTNITVPAAISVSIVAAYAGSSEPVPGRPTVAVFENDVDCFDVGEGRLGSRHAAALPPVDMRFSGDPGPITVSDVAFDEGVDVSDLDAGAATTQIVLASDESNVVGPEATPVVVGQLKIEYLVGNPPSDAPFELLEQIIDLDACPVATTTTTTTTTTSTTTTTTTSTTSTTVPLETTTTTTTTAPPAEPAPIVVAVPTFTG